MLVDGVPPPLNLATTKGGMKITMRKPHNSDTKKSDEFLQNATSESLVMTGKKAYHFCGLQVRP